jgi:SSS family solute:Na+ symporter
MLLTIVGLYFVLMLTVGAVMSRFNKKASDFLVAGRRLGLILTTATMAGVQIGAGIVLGSSENAAQNGLWPGVWYGLGCGGGLILAGLFVAYRLRDTNGYVPLDFFGARYGERRWVRLWAWLSNIPSLLGIFVAQLMAAASVLAVFGFNYQYALIVVAAVIGVYCVLGGMWSIAIVDMVQVTILTIGVPATAFAVVSALHDPTAVPQMLAQPFIPAGMGSKAVFLILPFLLSISVSYDAFLRYQSAKTGFIARWGCVMSGVIVIFVSFCTALVGAAGRQLFPDVAPATVLPHVVQSLLHPVVAGLVVAALLGAAMSSGTGLLLSLAGCFSRDFYNSVLYPDKQLDDLKHAKTVSRVVIAVSLVVGVFIAFRATGILDTIIIVTYPYLASLLVPLLGGVFWKGATRQGAYAAMGVGGAIGLTAFVAALPGPQHGFINYDLGLLIAYAVSAVVFVATSLVTQPRSEPA